MLPSLPEKKQAGFTAAAHPRRVMSADGRPGRKGKPGDEQAEVVRSLCKTYQHTTSKLMYAFAALYEQSKADEESKTISAALANSHRAALLEHLSSTLASGVERVIRSPDLAMRSATLRDLRARFAPAEKDSSKFADAGTQMSPKLRRKAASTPKAIHELATENAPPPTMNKSASTADVPTVPATCEGESDEAKRKNLQRASALVERLRAWESRKAARIAAERERKSENEMKALIPEVRARCGRDRAEMTSCEQWHACVR